MISSRRLGPFREEDARPARHTAGISNLTIRSVRALGVLGRMPAYIEDGPQSIHLSLQLLQFNLGDRLRAVDRH